MRGRMASPVLPDLAMSNGAGMLGSLREIKVIIIPMQE
jgi:hypothetical protein